MLFAMFCRALEWKTHLGEKNDKLLDFLNLPSQHKLESWFYKRILFLVLLSKLYFSLISNSWFWSYHSLLGFHTSCRWYLNNILFYWIIHIALEYICAFNLLHVFRSCCKRVKIKIYMMNLYSDMKLFCSTFLIMKTYICLNIYT